MNSALQSQIASKPVEKSILELDARTKDSPLPKDRSHTVGPFSVLDLSRQPIAPSSSKAVEENAPISGQSDVADTTSPHTAESFESFNIMDDLLEDPSLFQVDFSWPYFPSTSDSYYFPEVEFRTNPSSEFNLATYSEPVLPHEPSNSLHDPSHDLTRSSAPATLLKDVSSSDAEMLLRHFDEQVIAHFSSLPPGEKRHWTILNIRSAILTLANITYMRPSHTSNAQVANLLALLAISARHLAHQNSIQGTHGASDWLSMSEATLRQAKEHLQYSLKSEVRLPARAKYKDQVMALSSMLAFAVRGSIRQHFMAVDNH